MKKMFHYLMFCFFTLSFLFTSAHANVISISESDGLQGPDKVIKSSQRYAWLGRSIATGDFNGDGIDDIALGAPRETSPRAISETGLISVFFGGSGFNELPNLFESKSGGKEDVLISGSTAQAFVGEKMTAGDLNGDNIDDLIIVAQRVNDRGDPVSAETAKIYIVFGSTSLSGIVNLGSNADATIARTDCMHIDYLTTGDVNGDGVDDLLISDILTSSTSNPPLAPLVNGERRAINGAVYLFYGGDSLHGSLDPASDADAIIMKNNGDDVFQVQSIAIGDVNGDGNNDIALGTPKTNGLVEGLEDTGQVHLIMGTVNLSGNIDINSTANTTIYGGLNNDQIGGTLAIGDINNDSTSDLLIGAPMSALGELGPDGYGKVIVVFGQTTWASQIDLFDSADITITLGESARMGFKTGEGLLAKDINGDQVDDMIISSPHAFSRSGENGWIHAILGGTSLASTYSLDSDADMTILAPETVPTPADPLAAGEMGMTLAVGDYNNDGRPDLFTGAPTGLGNLSGIKTSAGWAAFFSDPTSENNDTPTESCLTFSNSYNLTIPSVDVFGTLVGVTFNYAGGFNFSLDFASITQADPLYTPAILAADLSLPIPCAEIVGTGRYSFVLKPTDDSFETWAIDLSSLGTP